MVCRRASENKFYIATILTIKPTKAGSKITATATDEAGNVSKATSKTVADKTAPSLTVKDIYSNSKTVSGKTEAGAMV